MKTQKQRILEVLKQWTSPVQALSKTGTMKLATRVGELRKQGYNIEDKWADDKMYCMSDHNGKTRFKIYRLRPPKPQTKWVK